MAYSSPKLCPTPPLSYFRLQLEEAGPLGVAYPIETWARDWEPVYVARADAPPFDEQFIGYGFTRNSQVSDREGRGLVMMNTE